MNCDKRTFNFCHWLSDTHRQDILHRFNIENFPIQKEMTKNDYVIILGDFGIWDNSKEENYILDWLDNKNFTTLFIDGNHENYDLLNTYPYVEWCGGRVQKIRPSILHLCRGEVFNINGKIFFVMGGASSHDIKDGILEIGDPRIKEWRKDYTKLFRINHLSWWKEELPNDEEMKNGLNNLDKVNNKVDYILTHSPSNSELILLGGKGLYEFDKLTSYIDDIKARCEYKKHFFGHMHINKYINMQDICLYENIIEIK